LWQSVTGERFVTDEAANPAVSIAFVERILQRPPLVDLVFTIALQNTYADARWFLLPNALDAAASSLGAGGVNAVETLAIEAPRRIVFGRAIGNAGFRALRLAAGAVVRLSRLSMTLWEEERVDSVEIDVIVARTVTIDGRPLEAWLEMDGTIAGQVDASAEDAVVLRSVTMAGLKSVLVSVAAESHVRSHVELIA